MARAIVVSGKALLAPSRIKRAATEDADREQVIKRAFYASHALFNQPPQPTHFGYNGKR